MALFKDTNPSVPVDSVAWGSSRSVRPGKRTRASGQVKVVLNRDALKELDLVMARGLEALAVQALQKAEAPDATEGTVTIGGIAYERTRGQALSDNSGFVSYVDGKRVGGDQDVKKPSRGFTVRGRGVSVALGFGWPARWQELGTVRQPPRPFLTPAVMSVVRDTGAVYGAMKAAFDGHVARQGRKLSRAIASGNLGTRDWRK